MAALPAPVAQVLACFRRRGSSNYGREAITQLEHALQAAAAARSAGAAPPLITAALLHDVGHLLHDLPDDAPDHEIDDRHEQLGAEWLAEYFAPEVVEPVRLHVAAKRYLCAVDPEYYAKLSEPSLQSLKLQGGPMTPAQAEHFAKHPHHAAAVALRRWDEAAKVPGLSTPPLEDYIDALCRSLLIPPPAHV